MIEPATIIAVSIILTVMLSAAYKTVTEHRDAYTNTARFHPKE